MSPKWLAQAQREVNYPTSSVKINYHALAKTCRLIVIIIINAFLVFLRKIKKFSFFSCTDFIICIFFAY